MAREMDLADQRGIDGVDIGVRIELQIGAADLDIVDVEQQAATGAAAERMDEFDLVHLVLREGEIA